MAKKIMLALLLLLMIGGSILQNHYVDNATMELTRDLEQVKTALENDDFALAAEAADTFCANWEKEKRKFEALFEHKEVDSISAAAKSLQSYCHTGAKEEALAHISAAAFYINHIKDIDTLEWENVF
ncbi:MAG: DUF4363 family protein [Burkholderiales bacterium]